MALAFPPFRPPSRPSSTAAAFLTLADFSAVAIDLFSFPSEGFRRSAWFESFRLLDRLGMAEGYQCSSPKTEDHRKRKSISNEPPTQVTLDGEWTLA